MSTKKIISIVAIAVILSAPFFVHPYLIYGDSMYPAFNDGDLVLVERVSANFFGPRRGEIIALYNPHKKTEVDVKRVIGLPGETVEVGEYDVTVTFISGEKQVFPQGSDIGGSGDNGRVFTMKLGPLDYFVLGDNRRTSADSRSFGAVQPHDIIGRVLLHIPH